VGFAGATADRVDDGRFVVVFEEERDRGRDLLFVALVGRLTVSVLFDEFVVVCSAGGRCRRFGGA